MTLVSTRILLGAAGAGGVGAGSYFFAVIGGATNAEKFNGVAVDSSNNIYASGNTSTSSTGGIDLFVVSYDNEGTIRWQKAKGKSGVFDTGGNCAVDSSDNLYISGGNDFRGNVITKFNSSGALQFDKQYDGTGNEGYDGPVAIDGSDNIFSYTRNSSNAGSGVMMKINSSGTLQFNRIFSDSNGMDAKGCAADSSGNSYGAGEYDDDANGTRNGFLAKYNSSGTVQWQRVTEGSSASKFLGVTTDGTNIYAVGTAVNLSTTFAFITKWNTSGTLQWQRRLGVTGTNYQFQDVALDSDGNIYCVGFYKPGNDTVIISKWNSSGTLQWARDFGRSGYGTRSYAIEVDSSDAVIISGETNGAGPGNTSAFVLRIPNDGTLTGTYNNMSYSTSSATSATPSFFQETSTCSENAHDMTATNLTGRTLQTTTYTSTTTDIE